MEIKKIFQYRYLILISALLLSAVGAYFSIYGIGMLFISKYTEVSIMAIALEICKVIVVGALSLYWKKIARSLKIYLTLGVIILSLVTSLGIYAYLSSAYQVAGNKIDAADKQTELFSSKKALFEKNIVRLQDELTLKNARITTLNNLRATQENRMDNESSNIRYTAQQSIKSADKQILALQNYTDTLNVRISSLNDSVSKYDVAAINLEQETINSDAGPLKYLSKLINTPMNKVVNWYVLLFILVFDPLAIALIVVSNRLGVAKKSEEIILPSNVKEEEETTGIAEYVTDEEGNFRLKEKLKEIEKTLEEKEQKLIISTEDLPVETISPPQINIVEMAEENTNQNTETDVDGNNTVKDENVYDEMAVTPLNELDEPYIEEKTVELVVADDQHIEVEDMDSGQKVVGENVDNGTKIVAESVSEANNEQIIVPPVQQMVRPRGLFVDLIDIMYDYGRFKLGDKVQPYDEYKKQIDENKIKYNSEKVILDFLIICNLLNITRIEDSTGAAYINKDYDSSVMLMGCITEEDYLKNFSFLS